MFAYPYWLVKVAKVVDRDFDEVKARYISTAGISPNTTYISINMAQFRGYSFGRIVSLNFDFATKAATISKDGVSLISGITAPVATYVFLVIGVTNTSRYSLAIANRSEVGHIITYNSTSITFQASQYFTCNVLYIKAASA